MTSSTLYAVEQRLALPGQPVDGPARGQNGRLGAFQRSDAREQLFRGQALCVRCAMSRQQRATWPRNCPLALAVADLCPFFEAREARDAS